MTLPRIVDRNAAEVALRSKLERLNVDGFARLLGPCFEDDALALYCPHCQARTLAGDGPLAYPAARLLVEPLGRREEALTYVCQSCGVTGTRWSLARTCLDDPRIYAELLRKTGAFG